MLEIVAMIAVGVLLFLGVRMFMQRQAQKMHERLQSEITEDTARQAALAVDDEQHKAIYQAIAAEDGQRAMALFKQASGAGIQDSIVAVQALYRFPQPAPSELRLELDVDSPAVIDSSEVQDELLEDAIDGVREDTEDHEPLAEADPETGEILGDNDSDVPNIPGASPEHESKTEPSDEVDARARELMNESGFDPDQELVVPEEWAEPEQEADGFHLEVQREDEKITLSHDDLQPWVQDQLYALLRDDQLDAATDLLAENSPLTQEEAHHFLKAFKNQS